MARGQTRGGIHAIRGFDYQATVILDRLSAHFDAHGVGATVRPEEIDDLDLTWFAADGVQKRRFEQIKKPREDRNLNPTGRPWTMAEVARDLLPDTLSHLEGNTHEQVWILGDGVETEVTALVAAGQTAPERASDVYWRTVHLLARDEALKVTVVEAQVRASLLRWSAPSNLPLAPDAALSNLMAEFRRYIVGLAGDPAIGNAYSTGARRVHALLPDVLARLRIESLFGSEEEVARRVRERLEHRYCLHPSVVGATLFRNLRGFINDISKQPGRWFDQDEFDLELRSVWPTMTPIREPPILDDGHIPRADLSARFTVGWSGRALEAVGVSGAGKTMLAAEVVERSRFVDPDRVVLYAEVRPETTLRDVLVGAAFHLRRFGIGRPFAVGVESMTASDTAMAQLAEALSSIPRSLLLLIDLVQGTCNEAFARDLATFVRSLDPLAFRIAVLGQESAFRQLTALDRGQLGVRSLDVRGFNVDEFITLALRRHPGPNHAHFHEVFHRVTAGRTAGLYARLALSLAGAPTLEAMTDLSQRPADEILERAEQLRFAGISDGARLAAEKLVCFALPFGRAEAEAVFPDDNVGAAIRDLFDLGLLRATSNEEYEMHEIVRAGLESLIAPHTRREAHGALANHYARQGDVVAEVLHLDRSSRSEEARERARASFLRGERWAGLAGFVTAHKLVTPGEVIRVMAVLDKVEGAYLLGEILTQLNEPVDVEEITAVLRSQTQRYVSDFNWALALVEACLSLEPEGLIDLIRFGLRVASEISRDQPEQDDHGLTVILIAARRHGRRIGPEVLATFDEAAPDTKRLLLPLLLADGRRDALRRALAFIADDEPDDLDRRRTRWSHRDLTVEGREAATEFLAALPDVEGHVMLAHRSPLLGPLAPAVWHNRRSLRPHCVDLLQTTGAEPAVQKAAIRVLALLAEPRLCSLCEVLAGQKDNPICGFAALAPSLVPTLVDRIRYEAILLNEGENIEVRITALAVLTAVGADLGALYELLTAPGVIEVGRPGIWRFLFLQMAARVPFAAAIPLLEAELWSAETGKANLLISSLMSLGRLPVAAATAMLQRASSHPDRLVRVTAALSLANRRTRTALTTLKERLTAETDPAIGGLLGTAIVASGAASVADLSGAPYESVHLSLWRCVLAARTRDASFAPQLVLFANDPKANWQLRRAAINAAGFLPFEAALSQMLPILREASPLTIDDHQSLYTHSMLSWLLLEAGTDLLSAFLGGEQRFVALVTGILEDAQADLIDSRGIAPGAETSKWLYHRLLERDWPANLGVLDDLINELNVPLLRNAVLRALKRTGRMELIEGELARAGHVWIATKCLLECLRGSPAGTAARLEMLVARSPIAGEPRITFILDRAREDEVAAKPTLSTSEEVKPVPQKSTFSYEEAVSALTGIEPDAELRRRAPLVFAEMTFAQFEHLLRLADPANDRDVAAERYIPEVSLGRESHTVARRERTYTGSSEAAGAWIRPALVAVNRFDIPINWHEKLLSGPYPDAYAERLLACLAAAGNAEAFYRLLDRDSDALLPHISSYRGRQQIAAYIDDRLVPFLTVYLSSGTDEIFAGLCGLARAIVSPSIDSVLTALFQRWTGTFVRGENAGPKRTSIDLWRAFNDLAGHPRFDLIEDWHGLLSPVLQCSLRWYEKQKVLRVLERDPRSYIQIESMLFKCDDWEHFRESEVDRLERAAERLFGEVAD
ncbi:hypothetical protein [Rhodospirillum sp. A1_3_36]|uniref:hypothetical protein n=1 Tax=Rhodospirillum sp. A1_3_36 TaxID=3391666 RepID=UPI0039A61E51